jgi:tetratricopeptide (TPR) repeat protein
MTTQAEPASLSGADPLLRRLVKESRLWPSIHDALDTYYKRRLKRAEGYERLWRLIHLWEATYITSAMVAASALRSDAKQLGPWLAVREDLWGVRFDRIRGEFSSQDEGALHGKMDRWLRVLNHVEQLESVNSQFLTTLRQALRHKTVDVSRFLNLWERVCAPRRVTDPKRCSLIDLCQLLNTFRNRLAHVPFPQKPITDLAAELEVLTLAAWDSGTTMDGGEIPAAHNSGKGGWLCGGFAGERILVRGSQTDDHDSEAIEFVYLPSASAREQTERFEAAPFLYFDDMHEPHVLTRLLHEEDGRIEYTRFQAEAQPIVEHRCADLSARVPRPSRTDYPSLETDAPAAPAEKSDSNAIPKSPERVPSTSQRSPIEDLPPMEQAKWYMQNEQFDRAISVYEKIVKTNRNYHIAWGRLAIALRERAARRPELEQTQALADLDRSLECLKQASNHISPDYRAEVAYYRSKSLWRKWSLTGRTDRQLLRDAVKSAVEAAQHLSADFILSWCDYVTKIEQDQ